MKISRLGLSLAGFYVVTSLLCVVAAFTTGDPKGNFVLLQLPIALQGGLLQSVGLAPLLSRLDWGTAYLLLALPTVIAQYACGALLGKLFGHARA